MKRMIYADNAATTKLDSAAFEAMIPWLTEEYGNASQPYSFARKPKKALLEARKIIADVIKAQPDEIFFTSGGTESDNWAIKGTAICDPDKRATIVSSIEHHAILRACESIEKLEYPVLYVSPDRKGVIKKESIEKIITDCTRLVSVMFSNNEIGTIEPIKELATIAHKHGAIFHTDAVQAVGHVPINVQDLEIDLLSASAHKFNGPKGIGFLYIRKGTSILPFSDGGSQEYGLRAGTENIAAIVGMATALKMHADRLCENTSYLLELENKLLSDIKELDFIRNGAESHLPGIVSLSFKDADGEQLLHRMDLKGICISTGSACDSVNTQVSHVIKAIQVPREYAQGTIRISLSINNSEEEVHQIAMALLQILKK